MEVKNLTMDDLSNIIGEVEEAEAIPISIDDAVAILSN